MNLCECNCGGETKEGNRFIHGHNLRGKIGELSHMWGTHNSEETKNIISLTLTGIHRNEITKKKISNFRKGIKLSKETKKKMSLSKTGNLNPMYDKPRPIGVGVGKWSLSNSGDLVKSSYERKLADWLYLHGIKFEYESKRFFLGNGVSYLPDFFIPEWELYIETKGYMSPENMIQHELFVKASYELLIIDKNNIDNLDETLNFLIVGSNISFYDKREN